MCITRRSDNVFVLNESPAIVHEIVIAELKLAADASPLKRARLCLHRADTDLVHEMLIVLSQKVFIRPHRHLNKAESFLLLEGEASVLFFDDEGEVVREEHLGRDSSRPFIYHIRNPVYHTQLVWSEYLVFYECTQGPFLREATQFPHWAPAEGSAEATAYLNRLRDRCTRLPPAGSRTTGSAHGTAAKNDTNY